MSNPHQNLWFKSSRSTGAKECVEVAFFGHDNVGVRDSKDPKGPHHTFPGTMWDSFMNALGQGFGDLPTGD